MFESICTTFALRKNKNTRNGVPTPMKLNIYNTGVSQMIPKQPANGFVST